MIEKYFKNLEWEYGITCRNTFKRYCKNHQVLKRTERNRNFLLECRKNFIMPRFIADRTRNVIGSNHSGGSRDRGCRIIKNLNAKILNFEIANTMAKLNTTHKTAAYLRKKMYRLAPQYIADTFIHQIKTTGILYFNKIMDKINIKYNKLEHSQTHKIEYSKDWLKNLTEIKIPKDVEMVLALGPKFAVTQTKKEIPIENIIADVENIITSDITNTMEHNKLRSKASTIISNHYHRADTRGNRQEHILKKAYQHTHQFFKQNPDLILTQSDKGNVSVLIKQQDYNKMMEDYFADHTKYFTLRKDPTQTLQNRNNAIVRKLFQHGHINKILKRQLTTTTARSPRPRCSPKIHKPGIRIIMNNIDSPSYNLAKYLSTFLTNIIPPTPYRIHNTTELKTHIDNIRIEPDEILISLDVVAMFECIPHKLVMRSLERRKKLILEKAEIDWGFFLDIVKFCTRDTNYFIFNNKTYKQREGLTIGGPVSAILAEMVISDIYDIAVYRSGLDIKLLKNYVDDSIIIIDKDEVENFFNIINEVDKSVKFTLEMEENNQMSYLDVTIHRSGYRLETAYFQKTTSKNRLLNFNSAHPYSQKIGMAYGLIKRIMDNTSPTYTQQSLEKIHNILHLNGFPRKIVNQLFDKYRMKSTTPGEISSGIHIFKSITYTPTLSENLRNLFQAHNPNLKLGFKPYTNVRKIIKPLYPPTLKEEKHSIVYKINCTQCTGTYIGHTGRKLKQRIYEHRNDIKRKKPSKTQTGAALHSINTGHLFDYDNTQILSIEKQYKKRLTLESIHINKHKDNCVNLRSDIENLNPSYTSLLNFVTQ